MHDLLALRLCNLCVLREIILQNVSYRRADIESLPIGCICRVDISTRRGPLPCATLRD